MPHSPNSKNIRTDTIIINSFILGTSASFNEMVKISPSYGRPSIIEDSINHRWEISGVIELSGECKGLITVRVPSVLAEKVLEKRGASFDNPVERELLVTKFVKRLINKTTIQTAPKLAQYDLSLKKPYTVYGKNHKINWSGNSPIISVPFRTALGTFELQSNILVTND